MDVFSLLVFDMDGVEITLEVSLITTYALGQTPHVLCYMLIWADLGPLSQSLLVTILYDLDETSIILLISLL